MAKEKRKYLKNQFHPQNPEKYVGKYPIIARSSWETTFMSKCDSHPDIIHWASESIYIPYKHPITGKPSLYIPDFLIHYLDKNRKQRTELVEIKPLKEAFESRTKSVYDKLSLLINAAKWKAAGEWCAKRGIHFRVMTERDIYAGYK